MLFDSERAWLQLRAFLCTKSGHGTFGPEGLLAKMAALEVECAVEEGPTERVMRLFGVELSEDLIQHPAADATDEQPNGSESSPVGRPASKGADHEQHHIRGPALVVRH